MRYSDEIYRSVFPVVEKDEVKPVVESVVPTMEQEDVKIQAKPMPEHPQIILDEEQGEFEDERNDSDDNASD